MTEPLNLPMVIDLDLTGVGDKGQLLDLLDETFGFPGWFGRNLDALIDCLGTFYFPQEESLCELANHGGGETILACRITEDNEKLLMVFVDVVSCVNARLSEMGVSSRFSIRPMLVRDA